MSVACAPSRARPGMTYVHICTHMSGQIPLYTSPSLDFAAPGPRPPRGRWRGGREGGREGRRGPPASKSKKGSRAFAHIDVCTLTSLFTTRISFALHTLYCALWGLVSWGTNRSYTYTPHFNNFTHVLCHKGLLARPFTGHENRH